MCSPNRILNTIVVLVLLSLLAHPSHAAVFQYRVPVTTAKAPAAAFLWIPSEARQLRGVVMAGMTLMERELVKDSVIRAACGKESLAIVFVTCGLSAIDVQKVLDDLAAASGYRELSAAPLLFVGHSAGGPQAKACAIKYAQRCFGLVQYRGGVPGGSEAVPPGIPALMMIGQFDEFGGTMRNDQGRESWEGGVEAMMAFRSADPRNLGSIVVEPGAGHFAWSERNARYLALFIQKAAQARIGDGPIDAKEPAPCKAIDAKAGWLSDLNLKAPGKFPPASHEQFTGDKSKAAWHLDRELAEATAAYHAGALTKKDQFIRWTDPTWVDAGARFYFTQLKWIGDGQTIEVHPCYADTYPIAQGNSGPRWAEAGKPVGHCAAPILLKHVGGPAVVTGPNTLRIQFDNLAPAGESGRVTVMAYSAGDAVYRYTEQVGMLPRGFSGFKSGKDQTLTFPAVGNLKPGSAPIKLTATSDAGLPVEYYVAHGPAEIVDGTLRISEIPARATYPIPVKIVAWQFGRGIDPLVKTAAPVEQTILIAGPNVP